MIQPIDKNNLDGLYGATATLLDWPEDLSDKAREAIDYFDDTAALFLYRGKLVITDESGWLTDYGFDEPDEPIGFPRATFDSEAEIEPWLEAVADEFDEE